MIRLAKHVFPLALGDCGNHIVHSKSEMIHNVCVCVCVCRH